MITTFPLSEGYSAIPLSGNSRLLGIDHHPGGALLVALIEEAPSYSMRYVDVLSLKEGDIAPERDAWRYLGSYEVDFVSFHVFAAE
jgi:hypothetical protein